MIILKRATCGHRPEWLVLIPLLAFVLLLSYIMYPSIRKTYSPFFPRSNNTSAPSNMTRTIAKDELELVLEGAATENRTLIIAIVNKAYAEEGSMLDLFLQSFRLGENTEILLHHLLVAAMDQTSFDRCNQLQLHCYKLVTDGVEFAGEKIYMSSDFIKMMWRRTKFLADVLRRGYSFIFTDTDVMWLRNPFPRPSNEEDDLQISCDSFNGNSFDKYHNAINTGFYYVASNNNTIALYDKWYNLRNDSQQTKEQDVLQRMIHKGVLEQLNLRVRFLDTRYFGGYCQSGRNFNEVVTLHANCCRTIKAKMADQLAFLEAWKKFRANATSAPGWVSYKACQESWKINV